MEKSQDQEKKKTYVSPELSVYGTVAQLTQHHDHNGNLDGGRNFLKTG